MHNSSFQSLTILLYYFIIIADALISKWHFNGGAHPGGANLNTFI